MMNETEDVVLSYREDPADDGAKDVGKRLKTV
jgi:hypothetical protein